MGSKKKANMGHNHIQPEELEAYLGRVEKLQEEKANLATDISEIFAEAKAKGYDTKVMRIVIKRRAMEAATRAEQDALVDTYSRAAGVEMLF